jgi:hypothetical protein
VFDTSAPLVPIHRRAFLQGSALFLTAAGTASPRALFADDPAPVVRIGLVTDLHYADKPPAGTRHYRETLPKLAEAAAQFTKASPAFLVELGDLIDAADSVQTERDWLTRIDKEFAAIAKERHYVLGNHCVDTLTKDEFLGGVGQPKSFYSFDRGGWHFVVLDACFRRDGEPYGRKNSKWDDANIPSAEIDWLKADLQATTGKTIVFAHQRLDGNTQHCVRNAADIRAAFAQSGNVAAVFQGHSHQNDYQFVAGIHYCTLAAMVEGSGVDSNGYALLDLLPDASLTVRGFRQQKNYRWM